MVSPILIEPALGSRDPTTALRSIVSSPVKPVSQIAELHYVGGALALLGSALCIGIVLLGSFRSQAEGFAEISGRIECVNSPANDEFRREFSFSFTCISGGN